MITTFFDYLYTVLKFVFSPTVFLALFIICFSIFIAFYYYITKDFDYWKKQGVDGPKPEFPLGKSFEYYSHLLEAEERLYKECLEKKYLGSFEFRTPTLLVTDPELIQTVLIKAFDNFADRNVICPVKTSQNGVAKVNGRKWRQMRYVITPTFSAAKLKIIRPILVDVADQLVNYLDKTMKMDGRVEMKDAFGRFAVSSIATTAFGVESNSFKDPNCDFVKNANTLFRCLTFHLEGRLANLTKIISLIFPSFSKYWPYFCPECKKAADFFVAIATKTINHRKETGLIRNDYLQLLLEASENDATEDKVFDRNAILANCLSFFAAGYETTSTLMTFLAYCLAMNPDVQKKVHEELDRIIEKYDGQITNEALSEMLYLDQVINETLRLYSPIARTERMCTKDYTFTKWNIRVKRGCKIVIPILMTHRNPEYYPDPLRFDPDRFLPENKATRHPCVFLSFGEGPRHCLGKRFGCYETKIAITKILKLYQFTPTETTPKQPMSLDPNSILLAPAGNQIWLKVLKRTDNTKL